jgi:probable DNA metabolism protein
MQTLVYDGSFAGFLSAVFDVYYYKFSDVDICQEKDFNGNIFTEPRRVHTSVYNSQRLWKGLEKKLSDDARKQLYRTFLSELPGIENTLLHYIQYAFASNVFIEEDYSHHAVLNITQTAKKVWREMHRMQAFVRFQKTADDLYYAIIEPDYNVLPLLTEHFENRYADQRWMIYDGKRKYGIFYNLKTVRRYRYILILTVVKGKTFVRYMMKMKLCTNSYGNNIFKALISSTKEYETPYSAHASALLEILTRKKRRQL